VPKPFVPLLRGGTLFEATLSRLSELAPASRTWVVSASNLAAPTRRALRGHRGVRLLLEPKARNTAAAVAWAAACVAADDPETVVGIFPADHHIPARKTFARTVRGAARVAAAGEHLVLVGVEPTRPDPAYGYLQLGARAQGPAHRVRRFVEKPGVSRARRFLRSGHYLWNAGMVVATAARILEEIEAHAPEIQAPLGGVLADLRAGRPVPRARLVRAWGRVRPISFDYAVLERTSRVLAIRAPFRWSDLGSWDALAEHLDQYRGNAVGGRLPAALVDAERNVIWNTTDKAVTLLGVRDLVVVETDDALLVCAKDRAQEVREVVRQLALGPRRGLT